MEPGIPATEPNPNILYRSGAYAVLLEDDGSLTLVSLQKDGFAWSSVVRQERGPEADALVADLQETNVRDPFQRQWMDREIAERMEALRQEPEKPLDITAIPPEETPPSQTFPVLTAFPDNSPEPSLEPGLTLVRQPALAGGKESIGKADSVIDVDFEEIPAEPAVGLVTRADRMLPPPDSVERSSEGDENRERPTPDSAPAGAPPGGPAQGPQPADKGEDLLQDWPSVDGGVRPFAHTGQPRNAPGGGMIPPKPKRIPIGDFRPEALSPKKTQNPYHPVRFLDERGRHVMTDEGYQINIRVRASMRDKVLLTALKEGQERYGEPVRIAGNPVFMAKMAKLAIENGIEIRPDGLFKAIAEREIHKAQAREMGHGEIGGGQKTVPEERLQPGMGQIHAKVMSVSDDGVVVQHAGREKVLDVPFTPDQRQALKGLEGQSAVLTFGKDGNIQIAPGRERGRDLGKTGTER